MVGIAPSTKFGNLITADHKILNVENESRCGHNNALIVALQYEFTNWIRSCPMKNERSIGANVVFTKVSSSVTEAGKNLHRQVKRDYQSLSRFAMVSRDKHPSSARNERSGRKCPPESERGNSFRTSAKWTTSRMVGLCDGMLLLLAYARQNGRWTGQHSRNVVRTWTDHQFHSEHWLSTSQLPRKTSQTSISLGKQH